jgi:Reverse transcriptase (RNA-dependent DNA polymerase)/Endonuclease-reverse transcriptase
MTKLAELIRSADKNSIFIGDFNLPSVDWDTGTARNSDRIVVEAVEDMFMQQLVDFTTHIRGNILDLVITNVPDRVMDVREEGRLGRSDHVMIAVEVSVHNNKPTPTVETRKDWAKADWAGLKQQLSTWNWRAELRNCDAETSWTKLREKVNSLVDSFVPVRPRKNNNRPPWMSQEILREIRRKKRIWKRDKNRTDKTEYKQQEKKVRNMIRAAKKKFERRLADGGGQNKRPFYAYVRASTKTRQGVGPLRDRDGKTVTENENMADLLNETFGKSFTREDAENVPDPEVIHRGENLDNIHVTVREVREKIRRLKKFSAPGPDGIGPGLLQEISTEVAPILASIYNKSLSTGQVPADWREANVTPIFKKGAKTAPENYRPVSLTSVCCKMLESIIKEKVLKHLKKHGLIKNSQHGFLPGRSCTTNLLAFFEKVTAEIDGGGSFDTIFLDFAKAFDKVPKERLLKKVKAHGITGNLLKWIRNWLSNRRQRVVLSGAFSDWIEVLSGVPQGSVLGPLLFLIFINDLDLAAEDADALAKFADDTKVGSKVHTDADRARLQSVLDRLCDWTSEWAMKFNVQKCKVMHFGKKNPKFAYTMEGVQLDDVTEERDIGITVTDNLKPAKQCAKAATTARAVLGQISRAFHFRDKNTFVKLYKTYVRPHLEFCTPAWSPWTKHDIECLEKVQNKMVNMISGLTGRNYEEKLAEIGLDTLEKRRTEFDICMAHKIMHGNGDLNPDLWFDKMPVGQVTRASADPLNIRPRAGNLELRKNFFSIRVVKQWNSIPSHVKSLSSPEKFKMELRKWMKTAPREQLFD